MSHWVSCPWLPADNNGVENTTYQQYSGVSCLVTIDLHTVICFSVNEDDDDDDAGGDDDNNNEFQIPDAVFGAGVADAIGANANGVITDAAGIFIMRKLIKKFRLTELP